MEQIINIDFLIGEIVYLKTDEEQKKRIVTAYLVDFNCVSYQLTQETLVSVHDGVEISNVKDITF